MSGEMNTSLGNGWTNLVLAYTIHCMKGGRPEDFDGVFEGDDALIVTDQEFTNADYALFGFDVKLDEVDDPTEASFCGQIFSSSGQTVRDPIKFINKFGWTHRDVFGTEQLMMESLRAKALSALQETPHCPIVSAIAYKAYLLTDGCSARCYDDGYHAVCDVSAEYAQPQPSPSTRALFCKLYGIVPELQVLCERAAMRGDMAFLSERKITCNKN